MSNQERTMLNVKGVFALTNTNKLSAGLEARYDYLEAPASIKGQKASDNTEAIYLQDELQIIKLLHITAQREFRLATDPKALGNAEGQ